VPSMDVSNAVKRLAARGVARTEADVQADLHLVLTSGSLALDPGDVVRLEQQVGDGTRRRLDVEVGHCVIEVKKDLRPETIRRDAEVQLAGYVTTQTRRLGTRYVGVLTDGTSWYLYRLSGDELEQVAELVLSETAPDADRLLVWLESILATREHVAPVPEEIDRRLGAASPAHQLDHASLLALYRAGRAVPEVRLKRDLWAKLLRTAFGTAFTDDERLFIDHTLLVLTAEVIAHAVVGFDITPAGGLTPTALARGTEFANAQIYGVVEADFFDWLLEVPGGPSFVTELARRVARFDWSQVEHDVLKTLYESVISTDDRASLGEYYTPDWLADRVVAATVSAPLTTRVLDPACGSGTFVFHAARAFLLAADRAGVPNGEAVLALTQHVYGLDVHPVAVTLARVTYLLAIGKARLAAPDRGPVAVPVYLGDAVQWEQRRDLLNDADKITISTAGTDLVDGGGTLFGDDLVFPAGVLHDAGDFDRLVTAMADKALDRTARSSTALIAPVLRQLGVHPADVPVLTETFDTMRRLHTTGRDHIWGYYVRNLIRPLWLTDPEHRVDVLVGNPPWLRYSKMTTGMQGRYKALARERGLLSGGLGASGRDLSTVFVARAVELYLRPAGTFAFVMPQGTLTRKPHDGFRSGRWSSASGHLTVAFTDPWDLAGVTTGFPIVSCVVHGTVAASAVPMPVTTSRWTGRLRRADVSWDQARAAVTVRPGTVAVLTAGQDTTASPYKRRFRNGAILYPRALMFVTRNSSGPLGAGAGRVSVGSRRTTSEKKPWSTVASQHGTVERQFIVDVHLGETVAPYRLLAPLQAVLPITGDGILTAENLEEHPALAAWWAATEDTWAAHRSPADTSALINRIDYHGQLSAQLPAAAHRVVYTASGNTLAAARVDDPRAVIEHKLYWAAVSGPDEARYLTAILNSRLVLERVKPLQALGLFGGRDFDKNVFAVPIPTFDRDDPDHRALAVLAAEAEQTAIAVPADPTRTFQQTRAAIRDELAASGVAQRIELAVGRVVPAVEIPAGPVHDDEPTGAAPQP